MIVPLDLPQPPDLLLRFVPTLFESVIVLGNQCVRVETNDAELLRNLNEIAGRSSSGECAVRCRLIRDNECSGSLGAQRFIAAGELAVLTCGNALILAADRDTNEVLGFIGSAVGTESLRDLVVPVLARLVAGLRAHMAAVQR